MNADAEKVAVAQRGARLRAGRSMTAQFDDHPGADGMTKALMEQDQVGFREEAGPGHPG